jgi:Ca2+/Na+ antiporter
MHKFWILVIIFILLFIFYLVISFGAGKKKKTPLSPEIKSYLTNVRVLITFIAVVSVILWFFM